MYIIEEYILQYTDEYDNYHDAICDALDYMTELYEQQVISMSSMARGMKINKVLGESDDEIDDEIDEDDFFKDL
jgi:hypothetical protein